MGVRCESNKGGLGFTWSDFGSSEQRKRHVKPNPDRP
ncbi:cation diffusion facilitator family transporter [Kroppenstedtia eburnea]